MLKRKIPNSLYKKLGHPDLGSVMYFTKNGKKIWGTVELVEFIGFKGSKDHVLIGIEPFKK